MTDPRASVASSETRPERSPVRSLLWLGGAALALLALLVAAFVSMMPASAGATGRRAFFGGHGHGPIDPAEMREHLVRGASLLASLADADDAQEARIEAIASALGDELAPLGERHRANRAVMIEALAGTTVDRAALEQARVAELALAAEASVALAEALADTAELLTPEQRATLLERHHRLHGER
jgi:Spy/CpxP family protein refolding chaperone